MGVIDDRRAAAQRDEWSDPLGGGWNSALDRATRREVFQRELSAVIADIVKVASTLDGLDRRKLADPAIRATGLSTAVEALAKAAADVAAVLHR